MIRIKEKRRMAVRKLSALLRRKTYYYIEK